jgi:beta-glucosidase
MTLQALGLYATEGSRMRVSVRVEDRALRELYLAPFEAAVREARVGTVMCAYNKLRGTYACENRALLEKILRDDWGFRGFTVADYAGAHSTERSLTSGLDFEPWPGFTYSPALVNAALLNGGVVGGVTRADIDLHVFRYLRTLFAHGALDRPAFPADESRIDRERHAAVARKIAERGTVLLRNSGHILPLRPDRLRSIAVIGPGATQYITGGGSSEIDPYSFTTPLEAIERRAGPGVEVRHDAGEDPAAAAELARSSDVAIVFAPDFETEGVDRACLSLECPPVYGDLDGLIEAVAAANRRTVVVLETGAPVLTPWRGRVAALIEAWYPGSRAGAAIARVLFGDVDASGRLPATFPAAEGDIPTAGDPAAYPGVGNVAIFSEGILTGYRHYDERRIEPAFPFGHGLSYTRMRFGGLRVRRVPSGAGKAIPGRGAPLARVSARIENVGSRQGVAVPQLYVGLPSRSWAAQPPRQFRGSRRLALAPGDARRIAFTLYRRDLSAWDQQRHRWRLVRGCHRISIGKSSRRLPASARLALGGNCA